ncbi:GGDEF domain-containing protein [Salibacterium lacus]|uniref:GGDEF domain-containing protein n=1 Tax=Salibacterium lacus TaxID=1898109 RepID=A0ABW5T4H1_9BACI
MTTYKWNTPGILYIVQFLQTRSQIAFLYILYGIFAAVMILDSVVLIDVSLSVVGAWGAFVGGGAVVLHYVFKQQRTGLLSIYLLLCMVWWSSAVLWSGGLSSPLFYYAQVVLLLYALSCSLLLLTAGAVFYSLTTIGSLLFYSVGTNNVVEPLSMIVVHLLTLAAGFFLLYAVEHYQQMWKHWKYRANTDYLTELYNREGFMERWDHTAPISGIFGVLDLDDFKTVNDQYGHEAGDVIIQRAGAALSNVVDDKGAAGRIGGDEFVMFLPADMSVEEAEAAVEHAISSAGTDLDAFAGASVGFVPYHKYTHDFQMLYSAADRKMYEKKAASFR